MPPWAPKRLSARRKRSSKRCKRDGRKPRKRGQRSAHRWKNVLTPLPSNPVPSCRRCASDLRAPRVSWRNRRRRLTTTAQCQRSALRRRRRRRRPRWPRWRQSLPLPKKPWSLGASSVRPTRQRSRSRSPARRETPPARRGRCRKSWRRCRKNYLQRENSGQSRRTRWRPSLAKQRAALAASLWS